jgi:hypothetical protein
MTSTYAAAVFLGTISVMAAPSARPASTLARVDPCAIVTPDQVGKVLNMKVGAGEPIGTTGCQWVGTASQRVRITLSFMDGQDFQVMKTPLPGVKKTPVSGVGDDAFYATVGPLTTLSVKSGKTIFGVAVYGVQGQDKQMAIEKALALDVTGKL